MIDNLTSIGKSCKNDIERFYLGEENKMIEAIKEELEKQAIL